MYNKNNYFTLYLAITSLFKRIYSTSTSQQEKIKNHLAKTPLILAGAISSLAFPPLFLFPCFFIGVSIFLLYIKHAKSLKQAFNFGWLFGFAHFTVGLYWIAIGVTVYINEFWWAIPFALFGLPFILGFFLAAVAAATRIFKDMHDLFIVFIFSFIWIVIEYIRSWLFTGFPWNLAGYIFCFSDKLLQFSSITGIYGLSFIGVFLSCNLYLLARSYSNFELYILVNPVDVFLKKWRNLDHSKTLQSNKQAWLIHTLTSIILILTVFTFGHYRLAHNPSEFTDIYVRLVQPSIPQISKWSKKLLYKNMKTHAELSRLPNNSNTVKAPDLIVWSESAVTLPLKEPKVREILTEALSKDTILITGGINEEIIPNKLQANLFDEYKLYSTMYGINAQGEILFNYNKAHLVPFGEYIPYNKILKLKKLTYGFVDYTAGELDKTVLVNTRKKMIHIRPLICYEAIFPNEARIKDKTVDMFINITNDSWYGNSSGPYQHFEITRVRAIENGIPLIRVGNNGISGFIDPLGRVIFKTRINDVSITDGYIPKKLNKRTIYSIYGNFIVIILLLFIIIVLMCIFKSYNFINKRKKYE